MDSGRLILITGPAAAGKTTLGHQVAARLSKAVHIDGDEIQRFVVSGAATMDVPPPPGAVEQLELRYAAALAVADLYQRAGFDAVLSDNVYEDHLIMMLRSALSNSGADRTFLVVLDPSVDAIRDRYRARPGGGYTDSLTPEILKQALARTPRIGLWLDTSGQTASQSTVDILDRLSEAAVHAADLDTARAESNM